MRQAYVCGPYSAATPDRIRANITRAVLAGLNLSRAGWFPIVPHAMGPHTATWDEAMERCRATIRALRPVQDVLVVLPGWERSQGSTEEVALARELGVKVRTLAEALRGPGT